MESIDVEQLRDKLRSKKDIYTVLHQSRKPSSSPSVLYAVQFNLPSFDHCPVKFLRDLLSG